MWFFRYIHFFAFLFFCVSACTVALALRLKRGSVLGYNLAFILAALGIFELYLVVPRPQNIPKYSDGTYFVEDPDLGYAISPQSRIVTSTLKTPDGSIVYDVKYSINHFGLRQVSSPLMQISQYDDNKSVFFFGDSFTFGAGVNDEDTLPQQFSLLSKMRAINFGVHGYGPHQMLRMLETDRPRTVESKDPLAIVYTLLPGEHERRAAGRVIWDRHGPHYEIIDGTLRYMGPFGPSSLVTRILLRSRIYSELLDEKIRYFITDADRQRLLAIVLRARDLSVSRYHAPFFVVLWNAYDQDDTNETWVAQRLEQNGVPTLRLSVSLPELKSDRFRLSIDSHPTGSAYSLVANELKAFLDKRPHDLSGLLPNRKSESFQ